MIAEPVRILVIDDEPAIRNLLRLNLESQGFVMTQAETGEAGLRAAEIFHPHLIILDLGLPDLSGFEVLKRFRAWTSIPILILTAAEDEDTKVDLLDAGADDYLTKPFGIPELLARIRVGLRNRRAIEATPVFRSGSLQVDVNQSICKMGDTVVKLTATELELLKILVREQGRVVSQKQLLTEVWGPHSLEQTQYLRIYIAQLRKKIELNPSSPQHILTEPGVGYRIV